MLDKYDYLPLSFSSLKAFSRSPLAFLEYKLAPRKETPAMAFGTLVHRAVLEPDKYETTTTIFEGRRAGARYEDFKLENAGKDILTPREAMDIRTIAGRIHDHPFAGPLVRDCQHYEYPFTMIMEGVPHRGIIDGLSAYSIIDLKTTSKVDRMSLQRQIYDFKYYMQAAIYQRAAQMLGFDCKAYFIVAVESAAPHHVQIVELEEDYIARGHIEWEELLTRWKDWDGKAAHGYEDLEGYKMNAPHWAPDLPIKL